MDVRCASVDDAEAIATVHVAWHRAYRGLIPDPYLTPVCLNRVPSGTTAFGEIKP
jgi:hypothetical protein